METQLELKSETTTTKATAEYFQAEFCGIAFRMLLQTQDADLVELLKGEGGFSVTIKRKSKD